MGPGTRWQRVAGTYAGSVSLVIHGNRVRKDLRKFHNDYILVDQPVRNAAVGRLIYVADDGHLFCMGRPRRTKS